MDQKSTWNFEWQNIRIRSRTTSVKSMVNAGFKKES